MKKSIDEVISSIADQIDRLKFIPLLFLVFSFLILLIFIDDIKLGIEFKGGTFIEIIGKHEIQFKDGFDYSLEYARDTFGNVYTRIFIDRFLNVSEINNLVSYFESIGIDRDSVSIEQISPTFGREFFKQVIMALMFAFALMSFGVFLRFRSPIPALTIIISIVSDIVTTLAFIIILGIEFTKGVFLALLLLIGYGVDSNVLLATRVLKEYKRFKDGYISAFKTGILMTITTISAGIALYTFSATKILKDIALVAVIGLASDFIYTWFLNSYLIKKIITKRRRKWRY